MDTTRRGFFKGAFKVGGAALLAPAALAEEAEPPVIRTGYAALNISIGRFAPTTTTFTWTECGFPAFYKPVTTKGV